MFKAVRAIKSSKRPPPLTVLSQNNKLIGTNQGKAEAIGKWFAQRLSDPADEPLDPFIGNPCPLNQPVTADEITKALKSLKNGHAAGPDNINNELLKYAASVISTPLANIVNMMFEQHTTLDSLGKGILIALPKPKKTLGSLSSLRPIVLLNCTRKVVSLVALHHIRKKINYLRSQLCRLSVDTTYAYSYSTVSSLGLPQDEHRYVSYIRYHQKRQTIGST